jgi:hypothetical protein
MTSLLDLFSYLPTINPGSQRAILGKATRRNKKITSTVKKGRTPLRRSLVSILKTFFTKKKFIPIGGVMSAISILTKYNTANQMGFRPMDVMSGRKMGMVIIIIVIPSMKHPRINRRICIKTTTKIGWGPTDVTQVTNCFARV